MNHKLSQSPQMIRQLFHFLFFTLFAQIVLGQKNIPLSFGSPFITNYTHEDYLETGKNWEITQGNDGRMYFANNYGLVQFDGYEWKRIGQPNNQSELRSFGIHKDRIYIGGTSEIGYFQNDTRGHSQYHVLNDFINDPTFTFNDVWDIATFKERIFFLTDNGMMMYVNDSVQIIGKGIPFRASAYGIDELIFAANDKGLFRFSNNQLTHLTPDKSFKDLQIRFILAIHPKTYLVGTDKRGVLVYDSKKLKLWNVRNQAFFIKNHLTNATILNKKYLLFGSLHEGLLMTDYDGNIVNIINEKDGLLDHNILSLYKDKQGNIWTAVDGSIAYLELNSPFTILNKKNGLRGEIYCILKHQNYLYVGTSRGLYVANWQPNQLAEPEFALIPKTTGQCWQLFEHQRQVLLAHHNGIYQIEKDQAIFIGGEGNWNFAAISGRQNLLLSGNYTGVALVEKTNNTYQIRHQIQGFQETARELVFNKNSIWISHGYQGIYQLNLSKDLTAFTNVRLYDTQKGLPSNLYNNLIVKDQEVLFGTQNGVYQYNKAKDLMEPNPLFANILGAETLIRKLYQMPNGNYLSIKNYDRTDETTLIEILEDGSYTLQQTPFQKLRGQLIPAFESVNFPDNQQILIGGKQGLIIYDANFGEISAKHHQCFIKEVSLKDNILFTGNPQQSNHILIEINPNDREKLRFAYATSFFEALPYMVYSTYLEGYDDNWQDWTTDNQRDLMNLPEGDYTFWVKSKNLYEVEGQSASFLFHIQHNSPLFTPATLWSLLFLLPVLLLFSYFFIRKRTHAMQHLKTELATQKQKINHYKEKKNLWKREKEQINQKLSNTLLQNEIHTGLIQKMEKLARNNSEAKDFKKAIAEFQDHLKGIQLQMDAHKTLEADGFLTKIKIAYPDLSARELRLCSYLKLNVSSKEIAEYLGISLRGVESLRYRVRKKLGLSTGQDLTEFILKF